MTDRMEYVEAMDRQIDEWEKAIDKLRSTIKNQANEKKETLFEQIDNLESKKQELKKRIDSIRSFSESQWKQMKIAVERSQHEFTTALNGLARKIES